MISGSKTMKEYTKLKNLRLKFDIMDIRLSFCSPHSAYMRRGACVLHPDLGTLEGRL
jgi:hypothetical protein